ncbi:39S ribosomal protein L52, mitochondrial [Colletes gigas]|uniref:39S ribosomal protein L52, mitochondrial n=1 Tax=Colletes gigas TaxID=935657 RepID=UPI001C9BB132|nr:39S ribosomal protein L52, mitochondrial [Colletes gigas]
MSLTRILMMLRPSRCTNLVSTVGEFHTSSVTYLNQVWRKKKGLMTNPNVRGPLTDLPDYSFKDNRPVPYGSNQLMRIKRHQEFARRVTQLVGEIDHAVEKHARLEREENERKQKILESKLKQKGQLSIDSE